MGIYDEIIDYLNAIEISIIWYCTLYEGYYYFEHVLGVSLYKILIQNTEMLML